MKTISKTITFLLLAIFTFTCSPNTNNSEDPNNSAYWLMNILYVSIPLPSFPFGTGTTTGTGAGTGAGNDTGTNYSWGTFTDNNNGTVALAVTAGTFGGNTYTAQTLTWMKCSHGQTWSSSGNNCQGTGSSPTYGAKTVQFCSTSGDYCSGGNSSNELGSGGILFGATSSAYTACNALNSGVGTFGKTNWRVPTIKELKLLINCTDKTMPSNQGSCTTNTSPAINNIFPNTQSSLYYWSSTTYSQDTAQAWVVAFDDGFVYYNYMSYNYYVRCVSGQ